jgi:hypothetical protein
VHPIGNLSNWWYDVARQRARMERSARGVRRGKIDVGSHESWQGERLSGRLAEPLFGSLVRVVMAAVLVISVLAVVTPTPALAAPAALEPREIALTPEDLPPGFRVSPQHSGEGPITNIGQMYQIGMVRELNEMNLMSGPVFVLQQVVRLESGLGAGDALTLQRNYWVNRAGYQISKIGANDGGTFSLEKTDDGVKTYLLGFVKENMIIITGLGGVDGVVSYAGVHELASISSARMDKLSGR